MLRRSIPRSCSETLAMSASKQNGVLSVVSIRMCTTRVKHLEHHRASEVIVPAYVGYDSEGVSQTSHPFPVVFTNSAITRSSST